ncbi:MAG: NAD-dependent epimerase/dehydratase family protein [Spirochaetes bacterium]|nr:NAD-dependent epimerase/dehydratase family protein [Spirochaetota bacterium]
MNSVLIIGGTGIISSEVCNKAVDSGFDVTILNRGKRREFINSKAKIIVADIFSKNTENLSHMIHDKEYDIIVDFLSYDVNQLKNKLALFKGKFKQYIYISSATVYKEKCDSLPYVESDKIGNDLWDYADKKAKAEKYLVAALGNEVPWTIIRPYITYGLTRIPYQFSPNEYYTIIHRIINNKPLPIFENNNKCTLTNSKDFAVGAVGLFNNKFAFGEAVNITSDCVLTWKDVALIIGRNLGKEVSLISLDKKDLNNNKLLGFDPAEIIGDKGRNMVFSNFKIKKLVPDFSGHVMFSDSINETISYYNSDSARKKVNYVWDARIDHLISKSIRNRIDDNGIHRSYFLQYSDKNRSFLRIIKYYLNRYDGLFFFLMTIRKMLKFMKKVVSRTQNLISHNSGHKYQ